MKKYPPKSNKAGIQLGPQRDDEIREIIQPQKWTLGATDDFDTIFARVNFKRGDYRRDGQQHQAASAQYSSKCEPANLENRATTTKNRIWLSAARAGETQNSVDNRYTSATV